MNLTDLLDPHDSRVPDLVDLLDWMCSGDPDFEPDVLDDDDQAEPDDAAQLRADATCGISFLSHKEPDR